MSTDNHPKAKVLFLCTGNSARSQMAEAFLRQHGGAEFEAYSAGIEPKGLNPLTVQVMSEAGLDLSGARSKGVREYMGYVNFAYLITVCSDAEEKCPAVFPGVSRRRHWPFEDPAAFVGSPEAKLAKFREVRDQIEAKVKDWVGEQIKALS
jgi:arsenate reductase